MSKRFIICLFITIFCSTRAMDYNQHNNLKKTKHWLTNQEKREYKAIRAALFAKDPQFKKEFDIKYPHRITRKSIARLIKNEHVIYSPDESGRKGSIWLKNFPAKYTVSGNLAVAIYEAFEGRGAVDEFYASQKRIKQKVDAERERIKQENLCKDQLFIKAMSNLSSEERLYLLEILRSKH